MQDYNHSHIQSVKLRKHSSIPYLPTMLGDVLVGFEGGVCQKYGFNLGAGRSRKNVVRKGRSLRASIIVEKKYLKNVNVNCPGGACPRTSILLSTDSISSTSLSIFFANIVDPSLQLRPSTAISILHDYNHSLFSRIFI